MFNPVPLLVKWFELSLVQYSMLALACSGLLRLAVNLVTGRRLSR